ncbi:hypothetical protein EYC80_002507 [Monilinia laxa]|uniref:Uncharacterized protein n=2 Tax=Monilinia laxa TaxID=61186 RepID=A0A5N6K408_MONLA|nr:hypothetical protein EYC80_002507 [Monilinia laxa]
MAGTKKKKRMGVYGSSQLPTGSLSLSALALAIGNRRKRKDPIFKLQEAEKAQGSTLSQSPTMEDEDSCEKCTESESDRECFLDDDMEFLPAIWGKDDKLNGDHERVEIDIESKVKKAKIQAPATMITTAYEKRTATASGHKVDLSQALAKFTKPSKVEMVDMKKAESSLKAPCGPAGNIEEKKRRSTINIEDSPVETKPRFQDSAKTITKSNSQVLAAVECNACVKRSRILEIEPSTKLIEKMARQERDLKSAKTQAGSLRAEIEVLNQKHKLEMQKQVCQLNETHQKEMDAIKLDLEETEAALQKASTNLQNVRDKNTLVRTERRELDVKLVAVSKDVARLTEDISQLELQKNHALDSAKSLLKSLKESTQHLKTREFKLSLEERNSAVLQREVTSLRDENRRVRKQQSGFTSTSTRLQQLEYRRERDQYEDDAEYYREKRDTVRIELESIEKKLSNTTTKYTNFLRKSERVRLNCKELKKAHDLREPLVKIGVDIRLRFLDQARETIPDVSRDKTDMVLRTNGNFAAHRGNAAADAALFKGTLIPEEYKEEAEEIFKSLYQCPSNRYPQ